MRQQQREAIAQTFRRTLSYRDSGNNMLSPEMLAQLRLPYEARMVVWYGLREINECLRVYLDTLGGLSNDRW